MHILGILFGLLFVVFSAGSKAQEALCAEVKIEILQELTMERQGFEALMRITNSLDTFSLENVSVKVLFKDANDNPVIATSNTAAGNAAFFIRVDDTRDVTGLQQGADGFVSQGVIAPKKVGELRWLIIPTANAAGQTKDGKLFFVGAELKYSYGGKEEVVNVAADSIVVKPQPLLTLDYFLTQEVVGDNGFTQEIEPAEPYTLGVRINNNGFGTAKSVKIESAQPRIVENKLGLAVNFKILGSYIEDQPSSPSLLINFGNIEPKGVSTGRWIMESNLAGKFISFNASFTHADELGGELTSLLQATNANYLIRDVWMDLPGRDNVRDFLALNQAEELFVFESENTGLTGPLCTNCQTVAELTATVSQQGSSVSKFENEPHAGLSYAVAADPYSGTRILSRVVRGDGTLVHPQNAWLSKKRASDKINFDYFVNVFDNNSSGVYTLYWGGDVIDQPQAPVIQFLPDRVTYEGGDIGFLVKASDPNNTIPTLSHLQLPTGAGFILNEPNSGVFTWAPAVGQAGNYLVTFTASDGQLSTERSVNIRVNPAHDTDGDGMDDEWERNRFGDLSHDGTADTDGDGRSDLQEFEEGSNPLIAETMPAAPQILSPVFNADILEGSSQPLMPELIITNGSHDVGVGPVAIRFEVYKDESLTQLAATGLVNESENTTAWKIFPTDVVEDFEFEDNKLYYWRAKSVQIGEGEISSAWVKGQFFINTENDAPTAPQISAPTSGTQITAVSPTLAVTNSTDIDRDGLRYAFELYVEGALTEPVGTVSGLMGGDNGFTMWRVPKILLEDVRYVWRVVVTDEHGLSVTSPWGKFTVNSGNNPPGEPQVIYPESMAIVDVLDTNDSLTLKVANADDPEGESLAYYFELDTTNTFDSTNKQISGAVEEGDDQTQWKATGLTNGTHYYWRVKVSDGEIESQWVVREFTVSLQNQPPSVPVLQNPVDAVVVPSLNVFLEANPSVDPEGTIVSYTVEVYSNSELTQLVYSNLSLTPQWQLDNILANQTTYYWRVKAIDENARESEWSLTGIFTINVPQVNQAPTMSFVAPAQNVVMDESGVTIQWIDEDPDSSAQIHLFLQKTDDGMPYTISTELSEDLDGIDDTYKVMPDELSPGVYRIRALISDEEHVVNVSHCCTLTVPEPTQTSPLFSQWLFNEGSGTNTFSDVGGFTAPIKLTKVYDATATPATWVAGRNPAANSALAFDGRGAYVQIPKASSQPLLGDASLSFWINSTQLGDTKPASSQAIIGSHNNDTGDNIKWGSLGKQGQFGLAVGDTRMLGLTRVTDGQWHQVVITRSRTSANDDGIAKVYVDGKLDSVAIPADVKFTGLVNSFIGLGIHNRFFNETSGQIGSTSRFISGTLDDIQVFNRSLTPTEVRALYTAESGVEPAATGAYENFANQGIYQAEAASAYLAQVMTNATTYSGIGFIDYDSVANSYLEWVVNRNHAGPVTLEFVYANDSTTSNRDLQISINGVVVNPGLPFPRAGHLNTWGKVSLPVNLEQGVNRIRATAIHAVGGPNLDYMKIID